MMARESDMVKIFGKSDPEECYDEHISFYCRNFVFTSGNLDIYLRTQSEKLRIEHTSHVPANMLGWNASFCAGFVKGLLDSEASHRPDNLGSDDLRRIVELATACAADSITTGENVVSEEFVKTLK